MARIQFQDHILPHLIAIFTFLIITIGYFNPVFFENEYIIQGDIQQWKGGAQELIDFREQTGEEGLWTNSMFSGMPGYLINVEWSNKIVEGLHRVFTLGLPHPVRMIFAALLSFYILALSFKIRPYIAIATAIAFGLSSYMIIGIAAGHNARIGAIAYMPLVIAGIHLTLTGKRWLGFGLTTVAMALHLRLNHLQITYYLLLMVLIYGVVMLISKIRQGQIKEFAANIGLLVVAVIIALSSFFGEFWATYEYSKYSMRGKSELTNTSGDIGDSGLSKSYAFQYSNGIMEPMTLVIPNFMGGASYNLLVSDPDSNVRRALEKSGDQQTANQLARFTSGYWGKQSSTAPYYAGAVTFLLFVIGIIFANRKYKIWLLTTFILAIVLSWGSNFSSFNYLMFDYFPGYNKFRSVTFTIILAVLSMALLGGLGLEKLLSTVFNSQIKKKLWIAFGICAGLCALLVLAAGMLSLRSPFDSQLPAWFVRAMEQDRAALLRIDALRTLVFVAITFFSIWAILSKKINQNLGFAILILAAIVDIWSLDRRYLNDNNFQRRSQQAFFQETDADKFILQDPSLNYRVLNIGNIMSEARTSYRHQSIGGYHGAKLRRYQDLYDYAIEEQSQQMIEKVRSGDNDLSSLGVLNMLNTRYFYAGNAQNAVLPNAYAFGNVWFVSNLETVNSADEEIERIKTVDLENTAVIDISRFEAPSTSFDSADVITLISYAPNKLIYEYEAINEALAVFSEIYYPEGWVAFVDEKPVDILRANYVLRALSLPAGNHTVEFRFEPDPYFTGNKITLYGNFLVLMILLSTLGFELKSNFVGTEKTDEIIEP